MSVCVDLNGPLLIPIYNTLFAVGGEIYDVYTHVNRFQVDLDEGRYTEGYAVFTFVD